MIRVAAIEDDEVVRQEIFENIQRSIGEDEEIEISVFPSAEEYLASEVGYELVITDIELPGIDGMELAMRVKAKNPEVYLVFLTSYTEFAAESYIIEAYQYILKKDMEERLPCLVEKVIAEIKRSYEEFCWIANNRKAVKVLYKDILYIRKVKGSKYIEYVTAEETYTERLSINQVFDKLHSPAFILINRAYIINVYHIKRMKGTIIYMDNGEQIIIGRGQSGHVKEKIAEYWRMSR